MNTRHSRRHGRVEGRLRLFSENERGSCLPARDSRSCEAEKTCINRGLESSPVAETPGRRAVDPSMRRRLVARARTRSSEPPLNTPARWDQAIRDHCRQEAESPLKLKRLRSPGAITKTASKKKDGSPCQARSFGQGSTHDGTLVAGAEPRIADLLRDRPPRSPRPRASIRPPLLRRFR